MTFQQSGSYYIVRYSNGMDTGTIEYSSGQWFFYPDEDSSFTATQMAEILHFLRSI